VDTILFNMLILGGLCDTQGRVWRRNASDMCAVEITILEEVFSLVIQLHCCKIYMYIELNVVALSIDHSPAVICMQYIKSVEDMVHDPT